MKCPSHHPTSKVHVSNAKCHYWLGLWSPEAVFARFVYWTLVFFLLTFWILLPGRRQGRRELNSLSWGWDNLHNYAGFCMRHLSFLIHSFIPLLIHHLYMSVWSHGSLLHTLHYNPTWCCSFGSQVVLALDFGSSFRSTPLPIWHALISLFFEQFLLPVSTRCYRLLCMLLDPAQESAISPGVLECFDWRIVSERKVWVLTDTESRIFEKRKMRCLPFSLE